MFFYVFCIFAGFYFCTYLRLLDYFISHCFCFFFQRLHPHLVDKIKLKRLVNKQQLKTDKQQNIVTVLHKKLPITAKQANSV